MKRAQISVAVLFMGVLQLGDVGVTFAGGWYDDCQLAEWATVDGRGCCEGPEGPNHVCEGYTWEYQWVCTSVQGNCSGAGCNCYPQDYEDRLVYVHYGCSGTCSVICVADSPSTADVDPACPITEYVTLVESVPTWCKCDCE
jgi:hypothetical protein